VKGESNEPTFALDRRAQYPMGHVSRRMRPPPGPKMSMPAALPLKSNCVMGYARCDSVVATALAAAAASTLLSESVSWRLP